MLKLTRPIGRHLSMKTSLREVTEVCVRKFVIQVGFEWLYYMYHHNDLPVDWLHAILLS